MKKIYVITKTIWQCLLVLVEIIGITTFLVWGSSKLRPIIDPFDTVERYILFFTVYEIIVYVILSFINDARQDALLALKTGHELGLLYCESGAKQVRDELESDIEKQFNTGIFNFPDILMSYETLKTYLEEGDALSIRYNLLYISHQYEMCNLKWKFSFLLRIFK